ncbi:MAG: hydrogenase maturation protease [Myxococcales bacterium]|nr:hydrogenase maturation protease [Myxococcales bacterium]
MSAVTVIALGSRTACDDEAALLAAERLGERTGSAARIVLAGRPGPGLVDLLEPTVPTVVLDVVSAGRPAGEVIRLSLSAVTEAAVAGRPLSSHGFGPAEALRLAQSLGRPLPPGVLVGLQARSLTPGAGMSPAVREAIPALVEAAAAAVAELSSAAPREDDPCTSPA